MKKKSIIIIGGGFTGLSAAYELIQKKFDVTIIESEKSIGGLAGSFDVQTSKLDKFYHHWFTNDVHAIQLIKDLKLETRLLKKPTNTSMYYSNNFFKLSSPLDLMKFTPLKFTDRLRLGFLAIMARRIKHWKTLENITAKEWLIKIAGFNVYKVVWEPLLIGKFGTYADKISAVWFWNKIKLRGSSRGKKGQEELIYFKGSFQSFAEEISNSVKLLGGKIILNCPVVSISKKNDKWAVSSVGKTYFADYVLVTTALPIFTNFIKKWADSSYINKLNKIPYLANICLILELKKPLSDIYWLNINDPNFPFVAIIEHTNLDSKSNYSNSSIVYLSKYLPFNDRLYKMTSKEVMEYSIPYIKKMFPLFSKKNIINYYLWKARFAQPVVLKNYSTLIPSELTPYPNLYLSTMAQIYPEDRGTNYAIRQGRNIASKIADNSF